MVTVPRAKVETIFSFQGGGIPPDIVAGILGASESQQSLKAVEGSIPVAEAKVGGGQDMLDNKAMNEDAKEGDQLSIPIGLSSIAMPPNKSKNQIDATKAEVAGGSHADADMRELKSFFDLHVLGPKLDTVPPDIAKKTMTAGWRRTWKGDGDSRVAKSRLFCRGFQDKRDLGWIETFSGTAEAGLARVALLSGLSRGWRAAKVDVKTAFLQTASDNELHLRMPADLPP